MGLQQEADKMKACRFSAKPLEQMPQSTRVFFISPQQVFAQMQQYATLYIATPLLSGQVLAAMQELCTGGLIVIYGEWTIEYEIILQRSFERHQTV